MINPGGIPRIPGDMDALARHAQELCGVGPAFASTGERVNSTWQQLAPVYDAPEVAGLLAATAPVQTTSASVGEDITTVGGALGTYASTVKQIQDQLDALRAQAQNLVAETEADKATESGLEQVGEFVGIGGDDDEYAERSNELTSQVNAQVAAFAEAQRVCANTINALYGGTQYRADDGDGHVEADEYGFTAEQLDAAFEQGQELPWGTYAETDTGIVGGVWDGAKMFVGDLGALIGRDPVTGEWSWATAGTAWKGLGTFALAIGVYAIPGGSIIDQQFNDGALGDTLLNAGKGIIAYDEWGKGDNARAGGMAGFNVLSAIVGTKGAGSALRGVGAGAQASRIGAVSRAGGAMVRGGELIGRLPTTESLIGKVSQHLPNLRLPDNIPDVNTPHHTDTPNLNTPSIDAPRVDTPNPGSVADNLADTGRPDAGNPSTPNLPDAPSAPDVDVPGPRGGEVPPVGAAVRDAPSAPDASSTPDTPSSPEGSALDTPSTPGDRSPGTGTPGDRSPGDGTPDGTTPGDRAPGDTTPGDTAPGDRTPDTGTPDTPDHTPTSPDGTPDGPTRDSPAPESTPDGTAPDGSAPAPDERTLPSGVERPNVDQTITVPESQQPGPRTPFSARTGLLPNTEYVVDGRGRFFTNEHGVITHLETSSGAKGAWNPELERPLPNATYVVDGRYVYETDGLGRTEHMHTDELGYDDRVDTDDRRNQSGQSDVGGRGGDRYDGGHLAGTKFLGPGERINLIPMLSDINRGAGDTFNALEREWRSILARNPDAEISVDIRPRYLDDDRVPDRVVVQYSIDGVKFRPKVFKNVN
ncbi:MAG: DNA/RNA non-specific endonuclease [Actinomycetota bacterium]|nr:DNA/RNA non-specific endonuclease [Actinomycetota bacterium]